MKRFSKLADMTSHLDIRIMSQTLIYIGSLSLGKITQILAIFLYSYMITPDQFGFYSVFTSLIWILAIAISANAHLAIGRYLYEDDVDNSVMMSTVLLWIFGISCAFGMLFLIASSFVVTGWPPMIWGCLLIVALGFVSESILTQISAYVQDARLLFMPSLLRAVISTLTTLAILGFNVNPGAKALIIGDAIGALPLIVYLFRTPIKLRIVASRGYLKRMFGYALPLTPYMLALTLLSQLDRIIIATLAGERAAGLYALSYNFGALPLLAATALTSALTKSFFDALKAGRIAELVKQADYAFGLSAVCFAAVMAAGQSAAWILLPSRYAAAFDIIPVVAFAGMVFAVFQIWVRVLAFRDRPGLISILASAGVAINVGLNVLLIPVLGFEAAAWTTVAAYAMMTLAVVVIVKREPGMGALNIGRMAVPLAIAAIGLPISQGLDDALFLRQILLILWYGAFATVVLWPIFTARAAPTAQRIA